MTLKVFMGELCAIGRKAVMYFDQIRLSICCRKHMAAFKVSKDFEFEDIPKTASGKMLCHVLQNRDRERYSKT